LLRTTIGEASNCSISYSFQFTLTVQNFATRKLVELQFSYSILSFLPCSKPMSVQKSFYLGLHFNRSRTFNWIKYNCSQNFRQATLNFYNSYSILCSILCASESPVVLLSSAWNIVCLELHFNRFQNVRYSLELQLEQTLQNSQFSRKK
jgi:hypothetical protein